MLFYRLIRIVNWPGRPVGYPGVRRRDGRCLAQRRVYGPRSEPDELEAEHRFLCDDTRSCKVVLCWPKTALGMCLISTALSSTCFFILP
jgi:hypothetical protein